MLLGLLACCAFIAAVYVTGVHDASNSVAVPVRTRALGEHSATYLAALFNVLGVLGAFRVFRLVGKRPGGHHRPERHRCCAAGLRYLGCAHLVFAFSVLLDPRADRCPRRCELVDPDEDRQRRRRVRFPRIPAAYLWGDSATALLPSAAHFSAVLADGGAVLPARGRPQPAPRESASPRGTGGVCLRDFAAARPADWLPVPAAVGATERTHH